MPRRRLRGLERVEHRHHVGQGVPVDRVGRPPPRQASMPVENRAVWHWLVSGTTLGRDDSCFQRPLGNGILGICGGRTHRRRAHRPHASRRRDRSRQRDQSHHLAAPARRADWKKPRRRCGHGDQWVRALFVSRFVRDVFAHCASNRLGPAGTVFSLFGMGSVFGGVPAGYLADRIGRKLYLLLALIVVPGDHRTISPALGEYGPIRCEG